MDSSWDAFIRKVSKHFNVTANTEFVLFMIGLQERGEGFRNYSKQEKMDLINLANCRLLCQCGYTQQTGEDEDGWPTFVTLKDANSLSPFEKDKLLKENIIQYFEQNLFN
jgi:hypothetical protein